MDNPAPLSINPVRVGPKKEQREREGKGREERQKL